MAIKKTTTKKAAKASTSSTSSGQAGSAQKKAAKKAPAKKVATKKAAKKVAAKKAAKKAPAKKAAKKAPAKASTSSASSGQAGSARKKPAKKVATKKAAKTTIIANVDVGFGNSLFIRGEGAGLSWEKGTQLDNVSPYEWSYTTTAAKGEVSFKFLINDEAWSDGDNLTVAAGGSSISSPAFSW